MIDRAVEICPMRPGDVEDCAWVFFRAAAARRSQALPGFGRPSAATSARISYLQGHDPSGSWIARDGGATVGFAQAALREGLWILVHLFVAPEHQGRGIGGALLELAHAYGLRVRCGIIGSSPDPRAISSYARLPGFAVYPALRCFGALPGPERDRPKGIWQASPADLEHANRIDRSVLGSARADDLAHVLAGGGELLLAEDGYAIATPGGPAVLAALDAVTATRLLLAALTLIPAGTQVEFGRITGEQQWAVRCLTERGLHLRPHGPVVLRGLAPPAPYLPHTAFS